MDPKLVANSLVLDNRRGLLQLERLALEARGGCVLARSLPRGGRTGGAKFESLRRVSGGRVAGPGPQSARLGLWSSDLSTMRSEVHRGDVGRASRASAGRGEASITGSLERGRRWIAATRR